MWTSFRDVSCKIIRDKQKTFIWNSDKNFFLVAVLRLKMEFDDFIPRSKPR